MAFDNRDLGAFKDIWVFCEQRDGKLMNTDFELISEGRKLADERGSELVGILIGHNVKDMAPELFGYGADKVYVIDDPALEIYTTDLYAKALCDIAEDIKPEVVLFGATNYGRDLAPRCAARMGTGLTADCTHLDIDMGNYVEFLKKASTLPPEKYEKFDMNDVNLKMTRPAFGGHLMATIICPRFRPCMSTVRPGVMKKAEFNEAAANAAKGDPNKIIDYKIEFAPEDLNTEVVEVVKAAKKIVDLIGADIIVSVGRGIAKNVELGIQLAQNLVDAFGGGVVGGSRVTVDSGWLSHDHQVGQTGKTVHPKIYVALGISGSIQHKAGMQESDLIIAVNKDPAAPIFEIADYGICGDLFKVAPLLTDAIAEAIANK